MPLFNNFPYTNFHEMNQDWIIRKVKSLEGMNNTIQELAGKYNDMYNKVQQLSQLYDSFTQTVIQQISMFLDQQMDDMNAAFDSMQNDMDEAFEDQNARISAVENRMSNLEQYTAEYLYMDSPFTGESVPVQEVIYQLASLHMTGAITAGDYDAAELTASAYDALDLTAYTYDWDASSYIS